MIHHALLKHKYNIDVAFRVIYKVEHEDHYIFKGYWYNLHYGYLIDTVDYITIYKDKLKEWRNIIV